MKEKMAGYLNPRIYVMGDAVLLHPAMCALREEAEQHGYSPVLLPYSSSYVRLAWEDCALFLLDPGLSLERLYLAAQARDRCVPVVLLADIRHPYTDAQWIALNWYPYIQKYNNPCLVDEIFLHLDQVRGKLSMTRALKILQEQSA